MAFADAQHLKYSTKTVFIQLTTPFSSSNSPNFDGTFEGPSRVHDSLIKSHYPGVDTSELTSFPTRQRLTLSIIVTVLCVLSICGNLSTLYVNTLSRRKLRPFFRACLISLAFSDLVNTVFLSMAYLAQFTSDYVQIWRLGQPMCTLVPFATTTSILASSMTLVGIAIDRYFAVMKAVIGFWNPSVVFCVACMLAIWGAAIAIASPVLCIYSLKSFYVVSDMENGALATESKIKDDHPSIIVVEVDQVVQICSSDLTNVSLYYVILFGIIFVPCIVAFVWLNTIIAKKIWIRRHTASLIRKTTKGLLPQTSANNVEQLQTQTSADTSRCSCPIHHTAGRSMPSSAPQPLDSVAPAAPTPANSSREARHIRMFTIILLMMAVFIFFRLPAWVFLLMRMYGNYTRFGHWIMYFSFGILNLTSCVLNPLFYTFLTQTIQCALFVKLKLWDGVCGLRPCCLDLQLREGQRIGDLCCIAIFCGCFSAASANIAPPQVAPRATPANCEVHCSPNGVLQQGEQAANVDKDEGVECSDDEESITDFHEYNQKIYTIYPLTLVSSSVTS